MSICLTVAQISTITGFTFKQINITRESIRIFTNVENYNYSVSTARGNGDLSPSYYTFQSQQERTLYLNGNSLYVQYVGPYINVQKN